MVTNSSNTQVPAKIMIFSASLAAGGAERFAVNLATHFNSQGMCVCSVSIQDVDSDFYTLPDGIIRRCLQRGNQVQIGSQLKRICRLVLSLRNVISEIKPDYLISISTIQNVIAIFASFGKPVRVIASERTSLGSCSQTGPWALLRRSIYRFAAAHVAQTSDAAEWLKRHAMARKVFIIPNMVTWPIPTIQPVISPEQWIKPGARLILAVGNIYPLKGFDLLIQAFVMVVHDHPDWHLAIVGSRDANENTVQALESLVVSNGLQTRIVFPGKVGNIADWYSRADLFVLSSRREGFPNALMEAMAAGCAAIAYDCPTGPREIIDDGINGLLVPPENIEALAQALHQLMRDDSIRNKMADNATQVRETYSMNFIMRQWEVVLQAANRDQPSPTLHPCNN